MHDITGWITLQMLKKKNSRANKCDGYLLISEQEV